MRTAYLSGQVCANTRRDDSGSEGDTYLDEDAQSIEEEGKPSNEHSDEEEDAPQTMNSYATLLQALKAQEPLPEPALKKRKFSNDQSYAQVVGSNGHGLHKAAQKNGHASHDTTLPVPEGQEPQAIQNLEGEIEEDEEELIDDDDSEGEQPESFDAFVGHFTYADDGSLASHIATPLVKRWSTTPPRVVGGSKMSTTLSTCRETDLLRSPSKIRHKKRLSASAKRILGKVSASQSDLAAPILQYWDVVCGERSTRDPAKLRNLVALHVLDHVFKTRDHVIKNNTRLSQHEGGDVPDLRDQGFTRPKVLFLLPTRQSCIKLVDSIVAICEPEQQENKARFLDSFGGEDDKTWDDKPEDFQELFGGNDDDMFRIGLKFTRKSVKYFSAFYSSDIIIASPLGLRNAIENGGGKDKEKKKGHDSDFLSSIEIAVVDHANALQMQNWQHVEYIFSQLNLLPKEAHGCDFSRVRPFYLDKNARHLRQTIILSDYITPEINALSSAHMLNVAGKAKYVLVYKGAMLDLPPTMPANTSQTFSRFDSPNPAKDPEARFQYFTSTILPSLLRDRHSKGTLIFIPSSFDFIRLRNHFATSTETESLSFGAISEYTSVRDVMRARSHFVSGRHSVLLYSERAHHFRRYALRGIKRVVFYGVPENPIFWAEIVGFLGLGSVAGDDETTVKAEGMVRAMFSKWDVLKLERIVGTERVKRLVADRGGDTFEFI